MGITKRTEEIGFNIVSRLPGFVRKLIIISANSLRKLSISNLKTPINLTLYVTNRCNAQCSHCFYSSELNKPCEELTIEQLKKISISLKHPLQTLMITGGEPFLRNDLLEICKLFFKLNKTRRITINTNGMLTDKIVKTTKEILKLNPKNFHIQVSIDGSKNIHDKMRGVKGCYTKAIETLKKLEELQSKQHNLNLSIMTTICKGNYKGLLSFCKEMSKNHPNVLHKFNFVRGSRMGTFGLPKDITSDLDTKVEQVPLEELDKLFYSISKVVSSNKDKVWEKAQRMKWRYSVEMLKSKRKLFKCLAGYTFGVIYPNGDVTICEPVKPFANLKDFEYNFYKLWSSDSAKKIKKMTRNCFCIHPCNLLDSMAYDTKALLRFF